MFFFFNDTATTEIYTLSLHDALPISPPLRAAHSHGLAAAAARRSRQGRWPRRARRPRRRRAAPACASADRKSTRLNSSHANISYAVFCLKKKRKKTDTREQLQ